MSLYSSAYYFCTREKNYGMEGYQSNYDPDETIETESPEKLVQSLFGEAGVRIVTVIKERLEAHSWNGLIMYRANFRDFQISCCDIFSDKKIELIQLFDKVGSKSGYKVIFLGIKDTSGFFTLKPSLPSSTVLTELQFSQPTDDDESSNFLPVEDKP
jgi:hypothetical protein